MAAREFDRLSRTDVVYGIRVGDKVEASQGGYDGFNARAYVTARAAAMGGTPVRRERTTRQTTFTEWEAVS